MLINIKINAHNSPIFISISASLRIYKQNAATETTLQNLNPYALYVAGNKNTLFTLWSISDQVTAEFITSFFSKLKAGVEQIKALAETKREFIIKSTHRIQSNGTQRRKSN